MMLSISGQSLPKIVLVNGDSNILISPAQLKFANRKIAAVDYLQPRVNAQFKMLVSDSLMLQTQHTANRTLTEKNIALELIAEAYKNKIEVQQQQNKKAVKAEKRKKRRAVIVGFALGTVVGLIVSIFI